MNFSKKRKYEFLINLIYNNKIRQNRLILKYLKKNNNLINLSRFITFYYLNKNQKLKKYNKIKNVCFISGKYRGYSRFFNTERLTIQRSAKLGYIPNITSGDW